MHKTVVRAGGSIAAAMLVVCMGCAGDPTNQRACFEPVPEWHVFGRSARGGDNLPDSTASALRPPPELISQNGLLETRFDVQPTTFSVAGAEVRGYAYQGQFIGPTLRVQPGDTVRVQLRNGLKEPTNLAQPRHVRLPHRHL